MDQGWGVCVPFIEAVHNVSTGQLLVLALHSCEVYCWPWTSFCFWGDLCDLCGDRDLSQEMNRQEKESDSVAHIKREPRPVMSSVLTFFSLWLRFWVSFSHSFKHRLAKRTNRSFCLWEWKTVYINALVYICVVLCLCVCVCINYLLLDRGEGVLSLS